MSYSLDYPVPVDQAPADLRVAFIKRTYAHLAGAVLAFVGILAGMLQVPGVREFGLNMTASLPMMFLLLGGFMVVSWVANSWALNSTSVGLQYLGLTLYVVVEAIIFLPLICRADAYFPGAIQSAGIMTLLVFGGLTAGVMFTGKDYSHIGPILGVGGMLAIGLIVVAMIAGFPLGIWFSFAMVALACGYIIYDTSNVMHRYNTNQHVAAALALFASVALLFFYILRIVMASRD